MLASDPSYVAVALMYYEWGPIQHRASPRKNVLEGSEVTVTKKEVVVYLSSKAGALSSSQRTLESDASYVRKAITSMDFPPSSGSL